MPSNQPLEAPTYMKQTYMHHTHKKIRTNWILHQESSSFEPSFNQTTYIYKLLFLRKVLNNCALISLYVNTRIRAVNKRELRREVAAVDVIDNRNI